MPSACDFTGVILAGGAGRRMFADHLATADKTLIDVCGRPMLSHVIERLEPQVGALILNANGDPSRFDGFGLEVVADENNSRDGPLAGFAAAMAWCELQPQRPAAIITVAGDSPFLPLDLVSRLASAAINGQPAVAVSAGQRHPTIGLWPLSLLPGLREALAEGRRRVNSFAEQHQAIEVAFPFGDIGGRAVDPFFNANTPEDIAAAHALLSGQP